MFKNIFIMFFALTVLFYIGEDKGQFVSGVQGEVKNDKWIAEADVRTYLLGVNAGGGVPGYVLYKVGIGHQNFRFVQECEHGVSRYDRSDPTGRRYFQFQFELPPAGKEN